MVKQGYKQTEIGVIPEDWECVKIEDVANISMCKRIFADQTTENGEIPFYKIGTFGKEADAFISRALYNEFKNRFSFPKKGDVLISAAGTLGRTVVYDGRDAYFQDSNIVWLDIDKMVLCNEYLNHYYRVIKWASSEGSTIARLYNGIIYATNIALPSLPEQQRIAEALSGVDSMITSLEKLIEKKKAIKQGAMQELLTGKKRLPEFSGEWDTYKFGNLCTICRGGSPRPIQDFLTTNDEGINWIKIGDVKSNAKYITSTQEKIIESGIAMSRRVYKGDFILSNSMSFGRPYILKIDGCIHDGWLAIQDYKDCFNTDFLYYLLSSEYVFNQYVQMAAGSSVQNLNKDKVAQLDIFLPSVTEQTAIASILSDMDSEIEALEQKLDKTRQLKQGMMQQLLTGKIRLV